MTIVFIIQMIIMFVFSISNDVLSVQWHVAREKEQPFRGAYIALILGVMGWLSFIWVLTTSLWLAVPDLVGTVIGSYYGIKYNKAPLPIAIALGLSSKPEIMKNTKSLYNTKTNEFIRDATPEEVTDADAAYMHGGGAGNILVDGITCYVGDGTKTPIKNKND